MRSMNRRTALKTVLMAVVPVRGSAAASVSTVIGNGTPGYSDTQVNNPYGVIRGPDRALYFCDLDNQRSGYSISDAANRRCGGQRRARVCRRRRTGDLRIAEHAARDRVRPSRSSLHRRARQPRGAKVDAATRVISTLAGTGTGGFSGDGGPASRAQLRQPHSIALGPDGRLLICDVGNHRIRAVDLASGTIETIGGTGERLPTPDGAPLTGTPLNGPRTMAIDRDGTIYLALREGNAWSASRRRRARSITWPALANQAMPATVVPLVSRSSPAPKDSRSRAAACIWRIPRRTHPAHRFGNGHHHHRPRHWDTRRRTRDRSASVQARPPARPVRRCRRLTLYVKATAKRTASGC